MSKHFHKYQNRAPKPVQSNFNPEGSIHENWVDGFNTGEEIGMKNGMTTGWCTGMATATLIVGGYVIVADLISQYMEHKRKTELEKKILDEANEKDSRKS